MARKIYNGEKNNKERTMNKLIQGVGTVLEKSGYTALTIANIARAAGVDRKLVTLYFGSVENLIETYIKRKDYWISLEQDTVKIEQNLTTDEIRGLLEGMLLNQMENFSENTEMQKAILWEISEHSDIMSHVAQSREKLSSQLFPIADTQLKGKDVDLRAITSVLVAGIYYLVLHSKATESTFCEIDLKSQEGMGSIREAIKKILKLTL